MWNGKQYSTGGVYDTVYTDRFGCDSISRLVLTVYHVDTIDTVAVICPSESIAWHGMTYSQTGKFDFPGTRSNGDRVIYRIDLTVKTLQEKPINFKVCDSEVAPVISTFTSAQERAVFAKALSSGRRFVKICPGGIPPENELDLAVATACAEGRGLLVSPAPPGAGINKQRAVWCNEYILKNAAEVWAGNITPGHTLASLVESLRPRFEASI